MPKTQQEIEELKGAYRKYLGRDAEQSAIDAFSGSQTSTEDRIQELLGSDEFKTRELSAAQSQVNPEVESSISAANRRRELSLQNLNEQDRYAQLEADQNSSVENQNYSRLQDALAKVYGQTREEDPYNKQGIRVAARDNFVTGEQARTTTENTQDLNLKLSNIAQKLNALKRSTGENRALTEKQTGEDILTAQTTGKQKALSLRDALISQTLKDRQDLGLQKYQLEQGLESGQSAYVPGIGNLTGRGEKKLNTIDLGDRIAFVDSQGNTVREVRKGLTPSASASGGSASFSKLGNSILGDIESAVSSGQYTATGEKGKQSREQLIAQLASKYTGKASADDIKQAVYSTFRGANEPAYTGTSKPATADQTTSSTFASRIAHSSPIVEQSFPKVNKAQLALFRSGALPNMVQGSDLQRFIAASKDIVAANLRKESGAAISKDELNDAFNRYIPLPGDKPAVIADKARTRQLILQGFIDASGNAYKGSQGGANNDPLGLF